MVRRHERDRGRVDAKGDVLVEEVATSRHPQEGYRTRLGCQMIEEQTNGENKPTPSSERPTSSDEGVDLTLIRMMREKTPAERLRWLNDAANGILRLRRARRVP